MKIKKLFSVILAIAIFCTTSTTSFSMTYALPEAPPIITPNYQAASAITPKTIYSNGDIIGTVTVMTTKDCRVEISLDIQRSSNGVSWTTVVNRPTVILTSGLRRTTDYTIENAATGYDYRVYAEIKIYVNNTLVDDIEIYSTSVSA